LCTRQKKVIWQRAKIYAPKEVTLSATKKLDAEHVVADEFKENIYYNLVYADKTEYDSTGVRHERTTLHCQNADDRI
jgi:hypothetical protein